MRTDIRIQAVNKARHPGYRLYMWPDTMIQTVDKANHQDTGCNEDHKQGYRLKVRPRTRIQV
jgi:hypothetical protein